MDYFTFEEEFDEVEFDSLLEEEEEEEEEL